MKATRRTNVHCRYPQAGNKLSECDVDGMHQHYLSAPAISKSSLPMGPPAHEIDPEVEKTGPSCSVTFRQVRITDKSSMRPAQIEDKSFE